jgi:transcriptional regulator with XRE-family HTH domain
MSYGLKIKLKRVEKNIKSKDFAKTIGISRTYLGLIESGKADNPSIKVLERAAKALNMPLSDLFTK